MGSRIHIDGRALEIEGKRNLLDVALSLGFDLPYFCWHPALGSVGACRQCAVKQFKDADDDKGKLVMACMTPASDGARISIADPEARDFRASVIEWLMVNHPHDCPVCDEGGECHLQDMTVMTGHEYRRFRFAKRTYRNQDLGPFINHEMNRCIQCYRCVRFYDDYAGGDDLQAFAAHDHVYFGRHEDGALESPFSGNLVEVCPTGVFTDKSLKRHYTRKWDLTTAPSVCVHCGLGCNTTPGARYGTLRRIRARYNEEVNGYFLCDRGRYGYAFVDDERRVRRPLAPQGPDLPAKPVGGEEAVARFAALLDGPVFGLGSPRASVESNFALRTLVGPERFFRGVSARSAALVETALSILRDGPCRTPSLHEVERCDAVLVLGEDVTNTAPMLDLAIRQSIRRQPLQVVEKLKIEAWQDRSVRDAVQEEKGPLFVATPAGTALDRVARRTFRGSPEAIARLGRAVAHALDGDLPAAEGLDDDDRQLAETIADALAAAERPLVVSGTGAGSAAVLRAAAAAAAAVGKRRDEGPAELVCAVPEANSLGLALLGGEPLEAAADAVAAALREGTTPTVVVLENDLFLRAPAEEVERLLGAAAHLVVLDHLATDTASRAELLLSAATFAEGDGTLVNNEGRAQRFVQVFSPEGEIRESWRWIGAAMTAAGRDEVAGWDSVDAVTAAVAAELPAFRGLPEEAPAATTRIAGAKVPREQARFSGRTSMYADRTVHEPPPPDDPDSPFRFSMEGYEGPRPASLVSEFWSPGWNSIQSLNRFQIEVGGPLRGGAPGVRLIEPNGGHGSGAGPAEEESGAREEPPGRTPDGTLRLVPLPHVFGSEELSRLAPGIAARAPGLHLALHPEDAERLGLEEGATATVRAPSGAVELPVRLRPDLARGLAAIPAGRAELAGLEAVDVVEIEEGTVR